MSEKRFTVDGLNIKDNSIKGRLYLLEKQGGVNALCNLINGLTNKLNRLEEENEGLDKENARVWSERIKDLEELKREHHILYAYIIDKSFEQDYLRWRKRNIQDPYKIPTINYEIKERQNRQSSLFEW